MCALVRITPLGSMTTPLPLMECRPLATVTKQRIFTSALRKFVAEASRPMAPGAGGRGAEVTAVDDDAVAADGFFSAVC